MDLCRAVPDDAPGIAAIEEATFPDPWNVPSIHSLISSEGAMCYVAREGGKVIAYILGRMIIPEGEIYRVAVRADRRRRGVAFRLMTYALKCERGRGLESTFLEVRKHNIPARNLYHELGFRDMGERKNYYKNPDDDAIVMLREGYGDMGII